MESLKNLKRAAVVFACLIIAVATICFVTADNQPQGITSDEPVVAVVSERVLIPGGHSVGVKMDVKGVLIVGLEDIVTSDGSIVNPGSEAGLEIGDTIIEINGTKVYKAKEVQSIVNEIKDDVKLKVQRKERVLNVEIEPVISKNDGLYKLGVWIKDKTAGIGTLTYYDPETETFGALGHGITDIETGIILDVNDGELLDSKVESVKQGKAGEPGEIRGIFYEEQEALGDLIKNTKFGIFGTADADIANELIGKPMAIATQEQVEEGTAYILTTIDGDKIEKFEINIRRVTPQKEADIKSMIIEVTDKELLERTGGIVQGMSGSPIIQNDRIVGAVTHVFVNDPTKGYGIFIENMLEAAE